MFNATCSIFMFVCCGWCVVERRGVPVHAGLECTGGPLIVERSLMVQLLGTTTPAYWQGYHGRRVTFFSATVVHIFRSEESCLERSLLLREFVVGVGFVPLLTAQYYSLPFPGFSAKVLSNRKRVISHGQEFDCWTWLGA